MPGRPAPQGGQPGMVVEHGFAAEVGLCREETGDVIGRDGVYWRILTQEGHEFVEGGCIVFECTAAEPAGVSGEYVSLPGFCE